MHSFSMTALPGAAASGVPFLWKESLWKLLMEFGGALESKLCYFRTV